MARTYRNIPANKETRTPRYKWKLAAGSGRKHIVTEYDDKPIAAAKECRHRLAWAE